MEQSIIKSHIQKLAGSGNLLKHSIIERSVEAANTEYATNYTPPTRHVIVAPTIQKTKLFWSREGSGIRTSAIFTPGDLIINPGGCFTRPQWDRETRFTLVAIEPTSISSICDELEIPLVDVTKKFHFQHSGLSQAVQRLIRSFETDTPFLLESEALELTMIRQLIARSRVIDEKLHKLSLPKLAVVKELIRENLSQPISLNDMARAAGYSGSRFLLLFRNATGYSPHQYLMGERLKMAHEQIIGTKLPFNRIAADCGFSDESHMIRLIKRNTGLTPKQLRG